MSNDVTRLQILALKGYISEMPEEDQIRIKDIQAQIRQIVEDAGDPGFLALSIVAPEIALEKQEASK